MIIAPQTPQSMAAALRRARGAVRRAIVRAAIDAGPDTWQWLRAEEELASLEVEALV
jgi:hypothetical protein